MNRTLLLAGVAATLFAVNANATEWNPYVSAKMSYTSLSSDTNINLHNTDRPAEMGSENPINKTFTDGVVGGHLAIGIAPYENLSIRHELEYNITGKQSNNTKVTTFTEPFDYKTSMETQALMFNTYYDFENESKFTPYVGLGVGVARLSGKIKNTSLWDNSAVGLKPGADIPLSIIKLRGVKSF